MPTRLISFLCIAIIAINAGACQRAGNVMLDPTPIQWQRVTFLATQLHPGFAITVPADWQEEVSDTGIMIFNDPRALGLPIEDAALPDGSIVANLSILSAADVQRLSAHDAASVVDAFIGAVYDDPLGPQYRDAATVKIEGRDNAQSYASVGGNDSLFLAVELSGNFALANIVAPEGELQRKSDLLSQIFDSLELRRSN